MASPRVDEIQNALRNTLASIPGVVAYPYHPQTYNYSQAIIVVGNYSTLRDTFSPKYTYTFEIEVYCLVQPPDYGQIMLAQLMSPSGTQSIEQVLLNNANLGGVVDDVAILPYVSTAAHAAMVWMQLGGVDFVRLIRDIEVYA